MATCGGENNIGDDIMLVTLIRNIRRCLSPCEIVIFTANRNNTKKLLKREGVPLEFLRTVYSGRWGILEPDRRFLGTALWIFETFFWIYKSDLLLLGGGIPIYDETNHFKLLFYLSRPMLSYLLNTPYSFVGISSGKVTWRFSKVLTKFLGNRTKFIAVRDFQSVTEFQALGIAKRKIIPFADLSFCE